MAKRQHSKNSSTPPVKQPNKDSLYSIKFDIPKEKRISPSDFTRSMEIILSSLEEFNHSIVTGTGDNTIQVISYIEELEGGNSIGWFPAAAARSIISKYHLGLEACVLVTCILILSIVAVVKLISNKGILTNCHTPVLSLSK